jgi:TolA-binding protein
MKLKRLTTAALSRACGVAAILLALAVPAAAQSVTSTDIQRLQDQVYDVSGDVARMRSSQDGAARLQSELDDLRDEVVYLKVKLRKEGTVNRADYNDVQNRLQDLRSRVRADARGNDATRSGDNPGGWRTNSDPAGTGVARGGVSGGVNGGVVTDDRTRPDQGRRTPDPTATGSNNTVIPSGQELDVRLETELSSATAQVEQRFQATTVADLYRGNEVLIPAGSVLRGVVSSVTKTTRMERKGSLTVAFDQVTIRGRNYPIRGTVTQALESEGIKGEAPKIGAGAGIGAIIGGIIGGVKGALLGVLIGGGGTIAATEGKDVTLPAGTILRVRLDTPPAIR